MTAAPAGGAPVLDRPTTESTPTRGTRVLEHFRDEHGRAREIVSRRGANGSVLVLDRDPRSADERLIAHLAADEPRRNARVACRAYLAVEPARRRCRALEELDELTAPFALPSGAGPDVLSDQAPEVRGARRAFRLRAVPCAMSIPSLRWTAHPLTDATAPEVVSLRQAIGALESYEPFREITRDALARHDGDPAISSTTLRAELTRVESSPVVLNRGLREAVLARVASGEASMSAIAIRCGRIKSDSGGTTGETSWLARRVGLLPEGGHCEPTRWVHSDVLALIAREGLGLAPREVELG